MIKTSVKQIDQLSIPGILNLQEPDLAFHLANLRLDIQRVLLGTQLLTRDLLHFGFHVPNHFALEGNVGVEVMFLFFQLLLDGVLENLVGGFESCDLGFD
jgi:hypothetical protein